MRANIRFLFRPLKHLTTFFFFTAFRYGLARSFPARHPPQRKVQPIFHHPQHANNQQSSKFSSEACSERTRRPLRTRSEPAPYTSRTGKPETGHPCPARTAKRSIPPRLRTGRAGSPPVPPARTAKCTRTNTCPPFFNIFNAILMHESENKFVLLQRLSGRKRHKDTTPYKIIM